VPELYIPPVKPPLVLLITLKWFNQTCPSMEIPKMAPSFSGVMMIV